jgi:hypothetical protein
VSDDIIRAANEQRSINQRANDAKTAERTLLRDLGRQFVSLAEANKVPTREITLVHIVESRPLLIGHSKTDVTIVARARGWGIFTDRPEGTTSLALRSDGVWMPAVFLVPETTRIPRELKGSNGTKTLICSETPFDVFRDGWIDVPAFKRALGREIEPYL